MKRPTRRDRRRDDQPRARRHADRDVILAAGARAVQSTPLIAGPASSSACSRRTTAYRAARRPGPQCPRPAGPTGRRLDRADPGRRGPPRRGRPPRPRKARFRRHVRGHRRYRHTPGSRVELINECERLGYTRSEMPADHAAAMALMHPEDREPLSARSRGLPGRRDPGVRGQGADAPQGWDLPLVPQARRRRAR